MANHTHAKTRNQMKRIETAQADIVASIVCIHRLVEHGCDRADEDCGHTLSVTAVVVTCTWAHNVRYCARNASKSFK